jgi:hypothetical protein
MSTQLKEGQQFIPKSRLGYPKLFTPEGIKGDPTSKPRYGCQILLPKTDVKTKAQIDAEFDRLAKIHFKGKMPKSKDLCLKDGDGEDGDENTKGCWVISANRAESQKRPQVVDKDGRTPLDSQDTKPYAGCVCNFLVTFYVPKNWPKITAALEIVQYVADGEPFGAGAVNAAAVMPDLSDEDEDI